MLRSPPHPVKTTDIVTILDGQSVLAIVRFRAPCDLATVFEAIRRGGIGLVEVTADTPGALEAVRASAIAGTPVGAGTIRSVGQARAFGEAGAAFLVSPGVAPVVVRTAVELGVPAVPGALSPTEISTAMDEGATAIKLFPARLGGPEYLRALRAPFADVPFVPTGGIEIGDVRSWLDAGAASVGLGSALVGSDPPPAGVGLEALTDRAARALELAKG
jgi:2-dehydro-3-deoxyphosphogluconate aldolase/(4S)-4-hydroxy-2-oxoglutarate aldolase